MSGRSMLKEPIGSGHVPLNVAKFRSKLKAGNAHDDINMPGLRVAYALLEAPGHPLATEIRYSQ